MPQYTPVLAPARTITATASADLTGGQLVGVTGTDGTSPTVAPTVNHTTTSTAKYLGVATADTTTGGRVAVHSGGVQALLASAGITAGAQVAPTAGGQVITWNGTLASEPVGIAITTASAGARVRVAMLR